MDTQDLATRLMEDIDPTLLDFIRTRVNSFVKWDLVRFFYHNPHTTDTAENIARYIGRDSQVVLPELVQLVNATLLQSVTLNEMTVYVMSSDADLQRLLGTFLAACEDRHFRVKAVYHVIRGLS